MITIHIRRIMNQLFQEVTVGKKQTQSRRGEAGDFIFKVDTFIVKINFKKCVKKYILQGKK